MENYIMIKYYESLKILLTLIKLLFFLIYWMIFILWNTTLFLIIPILPFLTFVNINDGITNISWFVNITITIILLLFGILFFIFLNNNFEKIKFLFIKYQDKIFNYLSFYVKIQKNINNKISIIKKLKNEWIK